MAWVLAIQSVNVLAQAPASPLTAIDIAIEPDAAMIQHAEAVNARLRSAYLKGFALDVSHHPYITLLQRYDDGWRSNCVNLN